MEYMLTFHILNVYVDKTQPHQFKFTFKATIIKSIEINGKVVVIEVKQWFIMQLHCICNKIQNTQSAIILM